MVEAVLKTQAGFNSGAHAIAGDRYLVTGTVTITTGSSELNIDTGLALIETCVVTIKDTNQAGGDAAYATYNHGADGLLDVYIWDDVGVGAANAATFSYMVVGTK